MDKPEGSLVRSRHRSISKTKVVKINFDAIEKTKSKENDEKGARFAGRGRGVEVKMRMVCGVIYSGMIQRLE